MLCHAVRFLAGLIGSTHWFMMTQIQIQVTSLSPSQQPPQPTSPGQLLPCTTGMQALYSRECMTGTFGTANNPDMFHYPARQQQEHINAASAHTAERAFCEAIWAWPATPHNGPHSIAEPNIPVV